AASVARPDAVPGTDLTSAFVPGAVGTAGSQFSTEQPTAEGFPTQQGFPTQPPAGFPTLPEVIGTPGPGEVPAPGGPGTSSKPLETATPKPTKTPKPTSTPTDTSTPTNTPTPAANPQRSVVALSKRTLIGNNTDIMTVTATLLDNDGHPVVGVYVQIVVKVTAPAGTRVNSVGGTENPFFTDANGSVYSTDQGCY